LLTEAIANPSKHKKKMLEIFFEKVQVPAAYVATQGILSL
jgi:centractin